MSIYKNAALWGVFVSAISIARASLENCSAGPSQVLGHCSKELPQGQGFDKPFNMSIESGGIDRWFLITLPSNYYSKDAVPVILSYHGGNQSAPEQMNLSQFSNLFFNNFALAVYPQGIDTIWEGTPGSNANDIQYTADIINRLEKDYCVNTSQIWAAGKSDGGGLVNRLACDPDLSKRIAAFAPVSGAYYVDHLPCRPETEEIPCSPGRPKIPMLEFHGGKDAVIPYDGGVVGRECLPTIPHFVQAWAVRDLLGLRNQSIQLTKDTLEYRYGSGCEAGLVTHVYDTTIGHDWPSTVKNHDNSRKGHIPASFNATSIIMDFFQRYSL